MALTLLGGGLIFDEMNSMRLAVLSVLFLALAGGCQEGLSRPWQQVDLPTHNRQAAYEAARDVLSQHFEIAQQSWTGGTIETRPQAFQGKMSGTLADIRGAGGAWRRTVYFELQSDGLAVTALVAVRLERNATNQAISVAQSGGYGSRPVDEPRDTPFASTAPSRNQQVWVETGYDAGMAREILAEITQTVSKAEKREGMPSGLTPSQEADETRRLGTELSK
jgi:hypothetical protein